MPNVNINRKIIFSAVRERLLLDVYPGASAAWSFRQLSLNYTGACFRLRRTSDNAETDIGFSNYYMDKAAVSSFCGANNGHVVKMYDQSGGTNHWIQGTGNNQALIFNFDGTFVEVNNRVAGFCDGINDYYSLTTPISAAQPWSVFQVTKRFSSAAIGPCLSSTTAGAPFTAMHYTDNNFYLRSSATTRVTSSTDTGNEQMVLTTIFNGSGGFLWKNGVALGLSTVAVAGVGNFVDMGRREGLITKGYFQEFVFYPSDQTANVSGIVGNQS